MSEPLDLDLIEKACAEATPGPWKTWGMEVRFDQANNSNVSDSVLVAKTFSLGPGGRPRTCDADFICAARSWVPALEARVRELEAQLKPLLEMYEDDGSIKSVAIRHDERESCVDAVEQIAVLKYPSDTGVPRPEHFRAFVTAAVEAIRARGATELGPT